MVERGTEYVGRLAPSPTGLIHLGIARTSLAAWLDARAHHGRLVLRIEDIDRRRCRDEAEPEIRRDLEWLGLDWDEGPARGGPAGPYRQQDRFAIYHEALDRLQAEGRTFRCTCSRKEIARAASAPHGPSDEGPRYPGTCRDQFRPREGRQPSVRLRTEPGEVVTHEDRRVGVLDQDVHGRVGDFVLARSDGMWAYQMAVTVDDLEQGITCIVRGDDLATSTPRQLLLRRLLRPDAPSMATLHLPMMCDEHGERLAKRSGSTTVAAYRESGHRPEDVIGQLAEGLGLGDGTAVRPAELIDAWRARYLPTDGVPPST